MRYDLTAEKQRSGMRNRLIRFFIAMLAAILVSEMLMNVLIRRLLLPAVQAVFLQSGAWDTDLTFVQLLVLLAGCAVLLLLQLPGWFLPAFRTVCLQMQEQVGGWITLHVPQITEETYISELHGPEGARLFLIFAGILLLKLLPYILFAILYIRYVIRETERARAIDQRYFRQLEKDRNLMLSDIAHDIRNPITTIAGYAQALEDGMVRDPDKRQEYLQAIRRKSSRVSELIQLLFEYTKLNSTGFSMEKKTMDLCELLREEVAELYADAEEKGMEIVPEIPEEPVRVTADPLQLARVFSNLLINAMRYNPPGTRILAAVRKDRDETGDMRVIIADTGQVIPAETAERIFVPFSRGDAARSTDGGSGLGLSIAASIIRMHGWELLLSESIPGYTKGFVIRIPW